MVAITDTTLRNTLSDAIDDAVNTGAGTATLKFETAADAVLATLNLQNPAFSAASNGTITLQGTTLSVAATATGTIDHVSLYDRDGTKQTEFTVGTGGADINLNYLTVDAVGQTVQITSFTLSPG